MADHMSVCGISRNGCRHVPRRCADGCFLIHFDGFRNLNKRPAVLECAGRVEPLIFDEQVLHPDSFPKIFAAEERGSPFIEGNNLPQVIDGEEVDIFQSPDRGSLEDRFVKALKDEVIIIDYIEAAPAFEAPGVALLLIKRRFAHYTLKMIVAIAHLAQSHHFSATTSISILAPLGRPAA